MMSVAHRPSRRWFLGATALWLFQPAWAGAPASSPRPAARVAGGSAVISTRAVPAASTAALIDEARLGGAVGFVVADAATGQILESSGGTQGLPPASVAKAFTSLYALDRLGADHRFKTRLLATGPVRGGRLEGDLILLGGGDPVLDTDDLGDMTAALVARGVRQISGRFLVSGGALPTVSSIDPVQPMQVGYNPGVSGLNLNHNRVHFEWKRANGSYEITMDARARRYQPPVFSARMQVVDRDGPLYTYGLSNGREDWTVMGRALGAGGSRWLPARQPDIYAGDVFRTLARAQGLTLPAPQRAGAISGAALVLHESPPLVEILRDMLRYSTNLTAEVVGLSATLAGGFPVADLAESGQQMANWARAKLGVGGVQFGDHSGLGDTSRISAQDMVRALAHPFAQSALRDILRPFPLRDRSKRSPPTNPVLVKAKTGTLNFVSGLAGYVTTPAGADLVFAIFVADLNRRNALAPEDRERPQGGRAWVSRARLLETRLIERWATVYGT